MKKHDCMDMFTISVLIIGLLQLMITRHSQVFNGKEQCNVKFSDLLKKYLF